MAELVEPCQAATRPPVPGVAQTGWLVVPFTLGYLSNTRALMELIVLNIGKDLALLPTDIFSLLVIMALVSTFMATPLIRWLIKGRERLATPPGQSAAGRPVTWGPQPSGALCFQGRDPGGRRRRPRTGPRLKVPGGSRRVGPAGRWLA